MRIFAIIMIFVIHTGCCMRENQIKYGNEIEIPNTIYGINFSNARLIDIISILQMKKVNFKCYDWEGEEFKWKGSKKDIDRIGSIEANYFVGSGLNSNKIVKVDYTVISPYMAFQVRITMEEDYYSNVLESLNKQFGEENAYINLGRYGEISWLAKKNIEPMDISDITVSKRQSVSDSPEKAAKRRLFYLTIITEGKSMEAEYRNYLEKEKLKTGNRIGM